MNMDLLKKISSLTYLKNTTFLKSDSSKRKLYNVHVSWIYKENIEWYFSSTSCIYKRKVYIKLCFAQISRWWVILIAFATLLLIVF